MSRLDRPQTKSSNPATKFLEYKSENKNFEYYDKVLEKKVVIEAPIKFLFLEHYHTVKGWHDATQKGIYSNEVYAISKDPVKVKTFGGLEISEGLYSETKEKIKLSGGVYFRSVYAMLENGDLVRFQFKGAVVGGVSKDFSINKIDIDGYSEFYKKNNRLFDNQWIEIKSFADAKKGATKYSVPIFEMGSTITDAQNDLCNNCAKILQDYVNEYTGKVPKEKELVNAVDAYLAKEEPEDDLAF